MMYIVASLCFRGSVGERPNKVFRGASAADGFLKIGETLDKEKRRDVRHVEVVEQNGLVDVQAFERGFVENEYRREF